MTCGVSGGVLVLLAASAVYKLKLYYHKNDRDNVRLML